MIRFDANVNSVLLNSNWPVQKQAETAEKTTEFSNTLKAVEKYLSKTNELQNSSDASIQDLLSGKNEDINSVVAAVAKADISFKLLVGVRNKLIEAYRQTMTMQI
jgi:flagellar hook-basal body complex protein FliE